MHKMGASVAKLNFAKNAKVLVTKKHLSRARKPK